MGTRGDGLGRDGDRESRECVRAELHRRYNISRIRRLSIRKEWTDLVEFDILYMALFPGKDDNFLNGAFFDEAPNRLTNLIPRASSYSHVVKVVDAAALGNGCKIRLNANTLKQRVVCYLERGAK